MVVVDGGDVGRRGRRPRLEVRRLGLQRRLLGLDVGRALGLQRRLLGLDVGRAQRLGLHVGVGVGVGG